MKKKEDFLQDLIEISHFYGNNKNYILSGGGNTSCKDSRFMYVKASGTSLATITTEGFVKLDLKKLMHIMHTSYPEKPIPREAAVKNDLYQSRVEAGTSLRPSVEAVIHGLLRKRFVVHTHPTIINSLLCSQSVSGPDAVLNLAAVLDGINDYIYLPYTDPGYVLSCAVYKEVEQFRKTHGNDPKIILLQNHGVFAAADTTEEIIAIYSKLTNAVEKKLRAAYKTIIKNSENIPISGFCDEILPALRMIFSGNRAEGCIVKIRNNPVIQHFTTKAEEMKKAALPFMPDEIVYCKSAPLCAYENKNAASIINEIQKELTKYQKKWNYDPKVILIKNIGMIAVETSARAAETVLDVYEDLMKISLGTESFGGPHFMKTEDIRFIDNWEVENYRRAASAAHRGGRVKNKIAIITGAAQGFGAGIAEELFSEGANIVIADLNEEKGIALAAKCNENKINNEAVFYKTDVSSAVSLRALMQYTVVTFGGLDIFIANAGVLRAGGLEEIDEKTFDFMTNINYKGYWLCVQAASRVLRTQAAYRDDYFTDIIQINSKSGLEGSNKNFTYAGGKFGGLGLTQSFAMELMPSRIKVNSICPGNFFEGPLWSDPKNGLFVQYLKARKVTGAKTIADVKRFYEQKVPAGRGCTVRDVMKAVYYCIEQQYETGQAVPVTGGQIMLK